MAVQYLCCIMPDQWSWTKLDTDVMASPGTCPLVACTCQEAAGQVYEDYST